MRRRRRRRQGGETHCSNHDVHGALHTGHAARPVHWHHHAGLAPLRVALGILRAVGLYRQAVDKGVQRDLQVVQEAELEVLALHRGPGEHVQHEAVLATAA